MGNCHPLKTNVNQGFTSVDIGFLGVTIFYVLSHAVNIYILTYIIVSDKYCHARILHYHYMVYLRSLDALDLMGKTLLRFLKIFGCYKSNYFYL